MANKYLKFEYWNTCDLGSIYYQGGQHFWFFLDGDVGEPFYEEIEDGQENGDGDFVPTYRRQIKKYLIKSSLVPDYLVDAMKRMELHDHIELTWKTGEVEQIYNVSVEADWQFEKKCYQGTITITFDMDEKITVGACCDNLTVDVYVEPVVLNSPAYFVSTTGNDANAGTIDAPWETWQKGFETIVAGDTLYIRGGTYQPTGTSAGTPFATEWWGGVAIVGKDGAAGNLIKVFAYPGETPILDGLNLTAAQGSVGSRFAIIMRNCEYWHLKGLVATGVVQIAGDIGAAGIRFSEDCKHNILEQVVSHDNGGSGICFVYDPDDNLILNCDSYGNNDPLSTPTPYNNSDGIEIAEVTNEAFVNTIRGCRVWDNSDDGIDLFDNEGIVVIENTWSFINGVAYSYAANGFKLGRTNNSHGVNRRILSNCIAMGNEAEGFTLGGDGYCDCLIYNCIAVDNNYGFHFYLTTSADCGTIIVRNCAAYGNVDNFRHLYAPMTADHNSLDVEFSPTGPACDATDFTNADISELQLPRFATGELPVIGCLHPVVGSDLRNAGIAIGGFDNDGDGVAWDSPPTIGAFEYVP